MVIPDYIEVMKISNYLEPNLVSFLDVETRDEALKAMVDLLDTGRKLKDKEKFHQAIIARENIVSTGIGMGVAIPHAKLPDYDNFFIAIGLLQKGIEWNALDGAPVRVIFMIGGPDDKQTEYLLILSNLTQKIKDEGIRKKLLTLKSQEGIIELFKE